MYYCTKYGLQHDTNSFALRRIWGGFENAKMFFAELNCHVFYALSQQPSDDRKFIKKTPNVFFK